MQDKTLLKIGESQLNKENYSKPYEVFIQNMYTTDNYKMLEIIFKVNTLKSGYKFSYEWIDTEVVSKKNYLKYAYREGTSKRSGDYFNSEIHSIITGLGFDNKKPIRKQQIKPFLFRKAFDDIVFHVLDLTETEHKEVFR